jgi:hypothetical protein
MQVPPRSKALLDFVTPMPTVVVLFRVRRNRCQKAAEWFVQVSKQLSRLLAKLAMSVRN